MKVRVSKRGDGVFDVLIQRTRRSEGNTTRAKGLSRDDLAVFCRREIDLIAHPPLPMATD